MPYNSVADSFYIKKLCSRLSFNWSAILNRNRPFCVFEPHLGDDHLGFIGKRVVDFLTVLIELFRYGVTAEALRANIGWKSAISLQLGPVDPKFSVEGVTPTNRSSFQKTRLDDLWYNIQFWTDLSSVLSQFTRVTDKRTDRQTDGQFSSL